MTAFSFPNLIIRYMVDCASSTRGASIPYTMFLTSIFKYFGVELEAEETVEVKIVIEGR